MLKKEIGDKRGIAQTLTNIGKVNLSKGSYDNAIKNGKASLETYRRS